jgi:hypothetical protein
LVAIAGGATLSDAADHAGCGRGAVWEWRRDDPVFAKDFEQAYSLGTDVLEKEATRRAMEGSDLLLLFLLKSRNPARFNRRMLEAVPAPEAAAALGAVTDNVHFYLPPNHRNEPEPVIELTPEEQAQFEQRRIQGWSPPAPATPVAPRPAPTPAAPVAHLDVWKKMASQ